MTIKELREALRGLPPGMVVTVNGQTDFGMEVDDCTFVNDKPEATFSIHNYEAADAAEAKHADHRL